MGTSASGKSCQIDCGGTHSLDLKMNVQCRGDAGEPASAAGSANLFLDFPTNVNQGVWICPICWCQLQPPGSCLPEPPNKNTSMKSWMGPSGYRSLTSPPKPIHSAGASNLSVRATWHQMLPPVVQPLSHCLTKPLVQLMRGPKLGFSVE